VWRNFDAEGWSDGVRRCLLRRREMSLELLLLYDGRIVRLETCSGERTARTKAHE
jgi:hypothetical protein